MEATFNALGGVLLKAIPTLILVILLHFYLKRVYFSPVERVRRARYEATEGVCTAAQSSIEQADAKAAEYEAAIRDARSEIYREHEETRRQWREEQEGAAQEARAQSNAMVERAKGGIASEVAASRQVLEAESTTLAVRIAESVLRAPGSTM